MDMYTSLLQQLSQVLLIHSRLLLILLLLQAIAGVEPFGEQEKKPCENRWIKVIAIKLTFLDTVLDGGSSSLPSCWGVAFFPLPISLPF